MLLLTMFIRSSFIFALFCLFCFLLFLKWPQLFLPLPLLTWLISFKTNKSRYISLHFSNNFSSISRISQEQKSLFKLTTIILAQAGSGVKTLVAWTVVRGCRHISSKQAFTPCPGKYALTPLSIWDRTLWYCVSFRVLNCSSGGRVPPWHVWLGNFCWPTGKREARKNGKMEKKEGKFKKGRWKLKMEGGKVTNACPFSKPLKFVLGLPKWKFSSGKKHFTPGKKVRKNDFASSAKLSSYAPAQVHCTGRTTFEPL